MFGSCLRSALSFLLLAFSLPLLAVSFLIAALSTAAVAMIPGLLKHNPPDAMAFKKLCVADQFNAGQSNIDQFNFEEGVRAYENLIGAQVAGAQVSTGAHVKRQQ
jgi:hypothetical protein